MRRLFALVATGLIVLTASAFALRSRDPIADFRGEFGPPGYGEPPAKDHYEVLCNERGTVADWLRLRRKMMASPRLKGWVKSDASWSPSGGGRVYAMSFDLPAANEHLQLWWSDFEWGEYPGLVLTYERPFNARERFISNFTDQPY